MAKPPRKVERKIEKKVATEYKKKVNINMQGQGDTHFYDGMIGDIYKTWKLIEEIPVAEEISISFEDTVREISELAEVTTGCKKYLELVKIDRKNNYDPKNNLNAEELLVVAWQMVKSNKELTHELILQIEDIKNGPCPQGRTTRLFQIITLVHDSCC